MNKNEVLIYYKKLKISENTLKRINQILKLPNFSLSKFATPLRLEAVNEALKWKKGYDQDNREVTKLYFVREYTAAIAKPGKEAAPDYKGCTHYITREKTNNENDMNPHILKDGKRVGENATFEDMFGDIEKLKHADLFGLELMGMLLFRAAFMLDHKKNKEGNLRYSPPEEILEILEERIPEVSGIPIRAFLHFLEILSLNEDIKMYTLGRPELKEDYGRINTLLTFVHLVAVLLNRRPLYKFAGNFARPPVGMAPIPKTERGGIFESFPLLNPNLFNPISQQTSLKD
ncbi:MAG: hypothetical protein Q8N63_03310 [Nanoarchaeota archaeon]|nr:hypothetical protein [Nanoarchaeota archaeon]